jgi:hypothetical protein
MGKGKTGVARSGLQHWQAFRWTGGKGKDGAIGGTPGSPMPVGRLVEGRM